MVCGQKNTNIVQPLFGCWLYEVFNIHSALHTVQVVCKATSFEKETGQKLNNECTKRPLLK